MKLCIISPISGLKKYASQSEGVHLALTHLVEESDEYADFYKERSEAGDTIILDNSAFEFGKPCSSQRLLEAAARIKAHVLVAPDYPGEDWERTAASTEDFCDEIRDTGYTAMGCPQSKPGDWRGWLRGVQVMTKMTVSHIGVSILATPNAFSKLVGNSKDIELSRMMATVVLKDAMTVGYVKKGDKKFHYLGAGHRLDLIRNYTIADSLDTSSPVWHGWNNIEYSNGFLPGGKISLPVDFHAMLENANEAMIQYNINILQSHARASEDVCRP